MMFRATVMPLGDIFLGGVMTHLQQLFHKLYCHQLLSALLHFICHFRTGFLLYLNPIQFVQLINTVLYI